MSHPPLLELSCREALPPEDQTFKNSEKAPDTHARLDILELATLKQGGGGVMPRLLRSVFKLFKLGRLELRIKIAYFSLNFRLVSQHPWRLINPFIDF